MTYKEDATVALYEADDTPLTANEVGKRMPASPTDTSTVMKGLYDDGFVDREGSGNPGDPYRYELTGKGEAAARDLANGDEVPEDAGLNALFDDEPVDDDDEDDEPPRDPTEERIADVERYVDGVESRLSSVEDAVGSNNVAREDVKHRLRELEDAVDGGDHVVTFDDKEFVETVLMVAQSDYGGSTKKRHVISTLLGVEDAEEKGLLSRALSAAAKTSTDDMAEDDRGATDE